VRAEVTADGITVHVESGAFEDSKHPRDRARTATAVSLGRILLRTRDRLHGGFGEAPADDDLSCGRWPRGRRTAPAAWPGWASR
jgi:hypothetical protein